MPMISESDVNVSVLLYFFFHIFPLPEEALSHAVTVSGSQKSVWEF